MALKAVSVIVLCLLVTCAAKQNCSEIQCKLLPVDEDVSSEFQAIKDSKNRVRMIYLNLLIGNDSNHPLESQDEFLPNRWVWASTIGELMLSLSYDYDILSWGLLTRQVRHMDVKLRDEPSGCLAYLDSSCQNIVVGQALLGNVTTKDGSGLHRSEDVVCVAKADVEFNFFDNFLESEIEYRCCKAVKQGRLDFVPRCELSILKSYWFKAFHVVLNVLTVIVASYSPALLFLLPDFVLNVRKECEKEQQNEEEEETQRQLQQNGYESIPSGEVQETVTEENMLMLSTVHPAKLGEAVDRNENESYENVQNINESNENEQNTNDPIEIELNAETNENNPNREEDANEQRPVEDEEKRKAEELPLDDGSPFNVSTLLYTCKSAEVFQHPHSAKLSFNTQLVIMWYCVIPFFFYIYLALFLTLKEEYFEELGSKLLLFEGYFLSVLDMTIPSNRIFLTVSYGVIPLPVMLILRPKDFKVERVDSAFICCRVKQYDDKLPFYIGEHALRRIKKSQEMFVRFVLSCGKVPIIGYKTFRNVCDNYVKVGGPRRKRLLWVLLALLSRVCVVTFCVITAAFLLFFFSLIYTVLLFRCSPYVSLLSFLRLKLQRNQRVIVESMFWAVIIGAIVGVLLSLFDVLPIKYNPFIYVMCSFTYPFVMALYSCRFVVKMFGYTIIGIIFNAGITAPIATFVATTTAYLFGCYLKLQRKYKVVKEIIFQEWKKGINESDKEGRPKVINNTIPKKLFWFVCDTSEVFPTQNHVCFMLRDMATIFLSAFFALCAIFFATDSDKIAPAASTIAVFVSGTIPMLLLRGMDHFDGWKKIAIERKIREAVGKFIHEKRWLEPVGSEAIAT